MKYYIINNETDKREGPYELEQLADAGVTPETYVWCKGMDDWQQAAEVADICRYWRNRLYDIMHPSQEGPTNNAPSGRMESGDQRTMGINRFGMPLPSVDELKTDINRKPDDTLWMAIIATIVCCPVSGFVAVYYSYMARNCWAKGEKENAHEMSRRAKLWTGITFFLGVMLMSILMFRAH